MIKNPIPWPGGARCAVAFTFDMDADSLLHLARPGQAHRLVAAQTVMRYGPEIAVPRILDSLRAFGLRQTFFLPAWCMQTYPQAVEAILRDGHEIGHHGFLHEHPNERSRHEEHFWLTRAIEVHVAMTGRRPRGWRAPLYNFSEHSAALLVEEKFAYDASLMGDDIPYLLRTDVGDLVEIPSHWGIDDWPQFAHFLELDYRVPIRSPRRAWEVFWEEFEAAWDHGGLWLPVWHPMVSGRLARWAETHRRIERMLSRGSVWFASLEEIAAHLRRVVADGSHVPRIQSMPIYPGPIARATYPGDPAAPAERGR